MVVAKRAAAVALVVWTAGCGTFVNRGIDQHTRWLEAQVTRGGSSAGEAPEGEARNYEATFDVGVSPIVDRGSEFNPGARNAAPNLLLYVRVDGQRTRIGGAANALELRAVHPLMLRRGTSVEVRLVDRRSGSFSLETDSRAESDVGLEIAEEQALAQFTFTFEGPGRYFFHRGYGLFFIDFRPLR